MSRLYGWLETDWNRKTDVTCRGHQELRAVLNYGSAQDSKPAVSVQVSYPKGSEKPRVTVVYGQGVERV